MNEIKSFAHINGHDYFESQKQNIKREIESLTKEYLLGVDEQEYKHYLFEKYQLETLAVDFENEELSEPVKGKQIVTDSHRRDTYQVDSYTFNIKYAYSGSSKIFEIRPSHWVMTTVPIFVRENPSLVSFKLITQKLDAQDFHTRKAQLKLSAFANLENANNDAAQWNNQLPGIIASIFSAQKASFERENNFYKEINLKVSSNKNNIFATPTIQKKTIVQPTVSKNTKFSPEPTMQMETYQDVIAMIYSSGKSMEKKPSLYSGKNEEAIRDQFLFVLESRYDGTAAAGEAFNKDGKTDIILKYTKDNSNLFIAECKIWKGSSEFHKAISQLFDKYLTWRDSKVAVMMFVQNNDFTSVLKTIKTEAPKHKNYVKDNGNHGESSFSYIFNLPQDNEKEVYLEVMAFHYHQ
jgi:hypothetical protein